MNSLFSTPSMRLLGGLSLVMLLVVLASYAALNFTQMQYLDVMPASISITGEGEVLAVPDIGQFTFSVEAEAPDAAGAQALSGTKINDIVAFLRESGVADTDIKTLNYNLYPNYRWEERVCLPGAFCGSGEQIPDGFGVSQSVQVKVRDTDAASTILTGVGEREATNISGLNFVVDDTDALLADARTAAIVDAKAQAALLADNLGVKLGPIVGFYEEDSRFAPEAYKMNNVAFEQMDESSFSGAELPMGEDKTVTRVTITYEIK